MYPSALENYFWYLNIVATAALIARLYFQSLARVYCLVFLYLILGYLQSMLALVFARHDSWTVAAYATGQTLKVAVAIFIPMELFRLASVQQPAVARFGRSLMGYFFAIAASLAALNVLFGAAARNYNNWLGRFLAFERSMDLAVTTVLVLMSVFLLWFPVRTRRNTAVCIGGFAIYSFQRWTGLLLIDLWPAHVRLFSTAMFCVSFACLTAWIVLLRRDGETTIVETGHRWNPVQAERLRFQLDAINARLGGSGAQ